MALTLNDVVESRQYQRTPSARHDLADTRVAAETRRERFSLEETDQRATARSQISTLASARNDAGRSRVERPWPSGVNASRPDAVKPAAPRTDIVRSEPERSSSAKRSVAPADRTRADAVKPAEDSTAPDLAKADTAGTDKATSETDGSESAAAEANQPEVRNERPETTAKPAPSKPPAPDRTGNPTAKTVVSEQVEAAAQIDETANASPASDTVAEDDATAVEASSETSGSSVSLPTVFAMPPAPVVPSVRSVSVTNTPSDGEAEINADGATTGSAAGLGATTGPARGAPTVKPGFEAALADIVTEGAGDDTAALLMTQGAEPAGGAMTAPSASSASTEAKATAAPQPTAAATPASAPVPLGAVPMTIGLRALGASSRFEIRLDPKDLGRVDVSIDIDRDKGTVGARLVVDRPETLALLQRDASSLQQALAQTGLDASAAISLSLRSDPGEGQRSGQEPGADAQAGRGQSDRSGSQAGPDQPPIDLVPLRVLRGLGRIDIRI